MFKVAILVYKAMAESIFRKQDIEFLKTFAEINPIEELPEKMTMEFMMEAVKDADACITCWNTPQLTKELFDANPKLRFVMHAAGAVRNLVCPEFWTMQGRHISSNAPVIANDVAGTTLAFILTSLKQMWALNDLTSSGKWKGGESGNFTTKSLYGANVAIIGFSHVGQEVFKILKPFRANVRVWDPYLSPIEAEMWGIEKVDDLNELISTADVITMHAPANEDCRNILNAENIKLIPDGALLVNTARGLEIDEPALIEELKTGRFFACLDVTSPEPPVPENPMRYMKNVILTPHMAGGHTIQVRHQLGANAIKEVYNYLTKGLIAYEVIGEMLDHMA